MKIAHFDNYPDAYVFLHALKLRPAESQPHIAAVYTFVDMLGIRVWAVVQYGLEEKLREPGLPGYELLDSIVF